MTQGASDLLVRLCRPQLVRFSTGRHDFLDQSGCRGTCESVICVPQMGSICAIPLAKAGAYWITSGGTWENEYRNPISSSTIPGGLVTRLYLRLMLEPSATCCHQLFSDGLSYGQACQGLYQLPLPICFHFEEHRFTGLGNKDVETTEIQPKYPHVRM
jgi:hypothetical protein